jgi:hypothetical protein
MKSSDNTDASTPSVENSLLASPKISPPRPWLFPCSLGLLIAAHLALTFYYERPGLIFSEVPQGWLDYDTHIEQVWRVTEALDGWGKAWAYDPYLLAGFPNGTIFDADNKGWELWVFALWKLGVPRGMAFNLFILLAHLMVPWVVFASARLFGSDKWVALLAAAFGVWLWYFDSFPHWCWWVGMIAWDIAGYFFLLPLALFYRYLHGGKWWHLALVAVTLSAGHLIHPYTFVILVLPMLAIYLRSFKNLRWPRHTSIFAAAGFVLLTNAYWLIAALRHWHYILDSAFYCQSTLDFFLTDYLGILKEPLVTGVLMNRTTLRFFLLFTAIAGFVYWRKDRDDRLLPMALGTGFMLVVAYMGGYSLVLSQIQPYRAVLPAMYLTLIPAAELIARFVRQGVFKGLPPAAKALFAIGLAALSAGLVRDALYFLPNALPNPQLTQDDELANIAVNPDFAVVDGAKGRQMEFRHGPAFEDFGQIADWLMENDKGTGRVLVEWWILGEHLAWKTNSQILGGFLEINLQHSAANLFRRDKGGDIGEEALQKYFEDYAVEWVILSRPHLAIEKKYGHLLEPIGYIPPLNRIYKTKIEPSFLARNRGTVKASLNRIEVTGTDPNEDAVLRYHFHETLVCKPNCTLKMEPLEDNPVGFIRVPAPHPADFVIENSYQWP